MPPKNIDKYMPTLYFESPSGHYEPLGKIVGMETHFLDEDAESFDTSDICSGVNMPKQPDLTLTAKWNPTIRTYYFLLTGRFPSNNWLRLHGWPMVRRCGYRKRKHK